jgi:hypothetical protein
MNTPTDLQVWLNQQAWPLGIIAALILFTYVALRISASRRRAALLRERAGVTEETFTEHLAQFGFDPAIASSTYRYLQEVQRVQFPILPTDRLDEDLGLGQEDVEQTVRELTSALHRELNPGLAHAPLLSVEDLVRLLQACPRAARTNAA